MITSFFLHFIMAHGGAYHVYTSNYPKKAALVPSLDADEQHFPSI